MDTPKRPAIAPTVPHTLYLETTNRCDSECQTCIRTFNTLEPPKGAASAADAASEDQARRDREGRATRTCNHMHRASAA